MSKQQYAMVCTRRRTAGSRHVTSQNICLAIVGILAVVAAIATVIIVANIAPAQACLFGIVC